ncbi:S8 family serine peptidase [Nonomuraea africana]|uniref:Type VII secretion-associated serine protease mycosin n=1 Tax=Nonomuraea africana TaxID=46171 RepID=A0ABR9KU99_9ACTN|nr:S8 family serine peptidase [Nonomuraea africana]MBE1565608.1 type VII secretion-associated serine protease mycosin [Nonomuraea africana]
MIVRGLLAGMLATQVLTAPAAAVRAPEVCDPPRGTLAVAEPWAQRRLDPKRVWPITRGEGVTVAVIDSGVDLTHPSLRVAGKADLTGTGYRDCIGHGTAVAGIIAAQHLKGVAFHGVAPGVRLLSFKQTNEERKGNPELLAKAIKTATDLKSDVINLSIEMEADDPRIRAAVAYALANNVVVVAAAGNVKKEDGTPAPAYPASYEGVISVGSAGPDGRLTSFSNAAGQVSVLGPGGTITSTWTGKSFATDLEGTSYAAPYVAGVAALVRARFPGLDQAQVKRRIMLTADGASGQGTGAGMVNPLLAVTAILPSENGPALAPPLPSALPAGVVSKVPPVNEHAISLGLIVAGGALAGIGIVVAARMLVPMGRRRGWRAGRAN